MSALVHSAFLAGVGRHAKGQWPDAMQTRVLAAVYLVTCRLPGRAFVCVLGYAMGAVEC